MLRILILATALATPLAAEPLALTQVTEWKAVYGRIEARDRLPARARIGGTLVTLTVAEGDSVTAGQELGRIVDDKLGFQLSAVDAQIEALTAQLTNAQTELQRGEDLLKRGVSTAQRLDALRTQVDVVLKGGMALGDRQWLSAKLSYYDNDINTSYVGLRPSEYRNDPSKNPAPHDHFLTNRTSFDLNHEWDIHPDVKLQTVVYWSQLERDYWRREVAARTAEGTTFKPCDGSVNCMVGRNRSFEMMGADSRLFVNFDGFGIRNEAELGVRLHRDKLSNQTVSSKTDPDARTGTLTGDDSQEADSVAFYGQNRFLLTETVATTLGLRIESYDQKRRNELTQASGQSSNTEVMPGLGVTWQLSPQAQLFAGAYKAFSPAMVATAISSSGQDQELDAERSNNVEVGIRGTVNRWQYEATAFQMDFSNQIVPQSESGGVGATVTNAGKTLHRGVESAVGFDFGQGWRLNANATYVPTARYNSQKVVSGVDRQGNRLPYAPELVANLGVSYRQGAFQGSVFAHHTSQQYVDPENTRTESVDGRRGLIPAYTTFNLSANYTLSKQVKFFGTVRNLFDKKYIASRNPDGIFPGAERHVEVGMSYKF